MYEYEKKVLLTRAEYMLLRGAAQEPVKEFTQTNYYYDTEDLAWNRKGVTCRIREKAGKYIATRKDHRLGDWDYSFESSREADGPSDSRFFDGMGVVPQGTLVTERLVLYQGDGVEAVLDKNIYLGKVDYEMEIEYTPESRDRAQKLLSHYEEIVRFSVREFRGFTETKWRSKSVRFFQWKKAVAEL